MSLDTKRAEIRKLEERARQRAEALSKSEAMLEEDAVRFDAFLKENDEKVQEAIRRAEAEAKAKADRVAEIKRLNGAIAALRSELGKKEEALADCGRREGRAAGPGSYQGFLDSVTPQEHFEKLAAARQERRAARLAAWQAGCAAVARRRDDAYLAKTRAEAAFSGARTQQEAERAERAVKEAAAELKEALRAKEAPRPDLDALEAADDASDETMHFKNPRQLLAVFSQLEEDNLFLIQNCQEAEEQLEEVKARHRAAVAKADSEVDALKGQITRLEGRVAAAHARAERLRERATEGGSGAPRLALGVGAGEGPTLDELGSKVAEVYGRCGFDPDASLTMLQMLTSMEVRLQECLAQVEPMPAEWVADVERSREKERRQVAREEKLRTQTEDHEARVQRALERAAAPVFKKTGKPPMPRSALPKRRVVQERSARDEEEEELAAFLARELL
ncbi:Coiled-coil domain-containing protein 37 [Monoraphidium neglectum]|uniref:Coiled-coil domain-containing protein 37 n=1 Tax=Monoraphidium neglectum TaxID=145388 RepID=A0A0D2KVI1_9CHLO|nr:Coiled-coil domain-containing protein 37 [Monoraphidium neglectum]KIY99393.1 Coiled-coil domain-containing protein 37 [Monoraphidium neglectum]|eukprot:XP_013898413.1 Coiled-coil domain-containing protein 37 [Monoraphidium neglectum]